MRSYLQGPPVSKWTIRAGWIMGILPCLLLLFSGVAKLIKPTGFAEAVAQMGWNEATMTYLGIVEIACTILYLIPQTSVLGAILLTGYLGGATATHVRIGDQFFTPILVGVILWGGLFLRDARLRALMPYRTKM